MRLNLILPILTALVLGCAAKESQTGLCVRYVSNTGFLIETGDRKLIIDGLLSSLESRYYYMPSDSVEGLMRRAEPPFDEIDLIAITHTHVDHFDAAVVAAHMVANSQVVLVGPPQAQEGLQATDVYALIKDRLTIVSPPADTVVELGLAGIHVSVLPSVHAPFWDTDSLTGERTDRHAAIQHLEYIFRMGDRVLYHCGDAALNDTERYRAFGFGDTTIDLAMVDWWDERDEISFDQKLIRDIIRPERIIMMHIFPGRRPRGEPDKQTLVAPQVILPDSLMQRWAWD